jgi:DNA-binding NarL/FixJ family response regulator
MTDLQEISAGASPILYVDEHRLSREAVSALLSRLLPDLKIESMARLDDLAGDADLNRYRLVILNTHTARVGDYRIAGQVAQMSRSPRASFLLISDVEDPDVIVEAFHLGARGYITTAQSWAEAADAIQFVASGGVAAPWNRLTAPDYSAAANPSRAVDLQPATRLTSRQLEVLSGLQQGKPNKVIAFELSMSESTVKVHIRQIMDKLHAKNRTQAALIAQRMMQGQGTVSPGPLPHLPFAKVAA